MRLNIIIFLIISAIVCGCSSGTNKIDKDKFKTGEIIPDVICTKDKGISYSLYLPSNYNENNNYPVIFTFDPNAKGRKPVELFHKTAEKYGYIIVGSNNSQNGQTSDQIMRIYEVMLNDVLSRFSIDQKRIYTAGFSGGSRVASSIAIFKGGITGVIGCAAGFPTLNQPVQYKFDYLGYVGSEDMNYLEMITLEKTLNNAGYRNHLIVFNGGHDWPPEEYIDDAFIWMEANAMKDLKKTVDKSFITTTCQKWQAIASETEKAGNIFESYIIYKKTYKYFSDLENLGEIYEKIQQLENNQEVKNEKIKQEENIAQEIKLQTYYIKALNEQSTSWWQSEIASLNSQIKNNTTDSLILKRVLSYLSLATYSMSVRYLSAGESDISGHYILLYSIIDPNNNEHAYLLACLNAKQGKNNDAFRALDNAISLGFNDKNRFQNDSLISKLQNDERYNEILNKISQNQ